MEQMIWDFDKRLWTAKRANLIVEIRAYSSTEAAYKFKELHGILPSTVFSGVEMHDVLGECARCNAIIMDCREYGKCEEDGSYLCETCLMETTEIAR